MNKKTIPAAIILILALVIAVGSQTFIGPCVHEDGSFGACHWAGRAMLGVGGLLAVLAVLAMLLKNERAGLYLASALTSVLGLVIPGGLISLCMMDTMRCRMVMKPAMLVLCAAALAVSAAGWLMARGRTKG